MADTTEAAEPTSTPDAENTDALGEAGKKALLAERKAAREAARERDALAARLREFEDRDKTESQRLIERAEAAEKTIPALQAQLLRMEVAYNKGLTPQQAKRLVGETREELEADADELLETFKPAEVENPAVLSLDLGARGATPYALNGDPLERDLRAKLGI